MEKPISNKIINEINKLPGCEVWKRRTSGSTNNTGYPDITGSAYGWRLEIEAKQPGCEPTSIQYKRLKTFRRLGCIAFWTDSVEDALNKLVMWLEVKQAGTVHPGFKDLEPPRVTVIQDLAA